MACLDRQRDCPPSIHQIVSVFLLFAGSATSIAKGADGELQFNRDIRPILSENCYHCHGPDESSQEAGLRLDTQEGATEAAIVQGDADASELYQRVISEDPDTVMPPPESERKLSAPQKERLRRWIDSGANYQRHWSFQAPMKPEVPSQTRFDAESWGTNAIDRFVGQRLSLANVSPAPGADKETLIRRITFDLIGLPPSLPEIDAYLQDTSERATEILIDRLLADPRYGERMAADWLDAARYSDTYGYQVDRDRFVWPYRDWVVNAFNENLGYDQFIRQQLAGDLLPNASRDQILATTFNRLHPQKVEGGSVPEEFRMEYVADRTQTVATAFLGLTMECCRCHAHKYDPITHAEYYKLSAFFANIDEAGLYSFFTPSIPTPTLPLPTESQTRQLEDLSREARQKQTDYQSAVSQKTSLADFDRQSFISVTPIEPEQPKPSDQQKKSQQPAKSQQQSKPQQKAPPETPEAASGESETVDASTDDTAPKTVSVDHLFAQPIESLDFEAPIKGANRQVDGVTGKAVELTGDDPIKLSVGNFRRDQPFSVSLWIKTPDVKERAVVFHRSRAWTDAASRGYQLLIEEGRLSWSLIHFWPGDAIRIRTEMPVKTNRWIHVTVTSDGSSTADGLGIFINGDRSATDVVRDHLTKQITGGGGDNIAIGQRFRDRGFTDGQVDQVRVFDLELSDLEIERLSQPDEMLSWDQSPATQWSAEQRALMERHLTLRHSEPVNAARAKLADTRRRLNSVMDAVSVIMAMREMPQRRPSYRLERGAYDARAEKVEPGTPESIMAFDPELPSNRLGLAQWMLKPDHPLTSRVAANRMWQICFGTGLVRTPEDFGSQGQPPTHPELLDWLAMDLVEHGWDLKRAIKQILLSSTYQLSSEHDDPGVSKRDPENRLLARQNAYRLPAEMLRDQSLGLSGQLVSVLGGPPVKPYEVEASFKPTKRDKGAGLYRRSLYTYWKRTGPAPAMMTLDASKRDVCRVQRERTSSPLQAFVLLNGPQYVEAARITARRLIQTHPEDSKAVLQDAFRTLTGRSPTLKESAVLEQFYESQLQYFQQSPESVRSYLGVGEQSFEDHPDPARLAATGVIVGTLMNFDESVMKR